MLRLNVIPLWKEPFVAFKMAPNIKNTHYISRVTDPYIKVIPIYWSFFLKQIAMHVLVHVRISCQIFVSFRQNGTKFKMQV